MTLLNDKTALLTQIEKSQRLLSLDLGAKTIGLAVSDTEFKIASPLATLKRKKFSQDAAALETIIEAENIGGLIIGLPLNMDGSEGARVQSTRAFIRNFENQFTNQFADQKRKLPIILWDERMSTIAVTRTLLEADISRAKRAKVVDKMAAAYILQGYLDFLQDQKQAP